MLFTIHFTDDPAHGAERARHMADHLAFLERHGEAIRAAGPLVDPVSGEVAGGLWLVDAPSLAEARKLVETDPFWPTGLRKAVDIREWRQVFAERQRLI